MRGHFFHFLKRDNKKLPRITFFMENLAKSNNMILFHLTDKMTILPTFETKSPMEELLDLRSVPLNVEIGNEQSVT